MLSNLEAKVSNFVYWYAYNEPVVPSQELTKMPAESIEDDYQVEATNGNAIFRTALINSYFARQVN